MNKEFVEHIEGIGEVLFVRNSRSKRMNLRLRPNEMVRVSYPAFVQADDARAFVLDRKQWILEHREKVDAEEKKSFFDPTQPFQTHYHEFHCKPHEHGTVKGAIRDRKVELLYPTSMPIDSPELQDVFKSVVVRVLRNEANFYLPGRVQHIAEKHGFSYAQLRIKNIKSRWGSCSARNNINLSLHLMTMPFHLIDHIILHELCHTVHKNHGPQFHALMEKLEPNTKQFDKEVNEHSMVWA